MKRRIILFFSLSVFFGLVSSAQVVKEVNLVRVPTKKEDASSGKKIFTISTPATWEFSDTACISLLKLLNPSLQPYYIISEKDTQKYIGTILKTEIAPLVFQYTITENFSDGSVKRSDVVNERGRKNGEHLEYWKPCVIKTFGAYMNGKRDGQWDNYDSLGRITSSMRFQSGEAEIPKLFKKPHKTYYSLIIASTPVRPYKINPGENPSLKWEIKETDYAQLWAFHGGIGYFLTPTLSKLNYNSMLGLPNGEHFSAQLSLTICDPGKFFGEMEWKKWIFPYVNGEYLSTDTKAGVTGSFVTFSFGHGIVKFKRSALAGMLGMTLAKADLTSKDLENSKGTAEAWFELSSLKQGPMLTPSIIYDLRFPFRGKYTPGICFKLGYHIPFAPAKWHLLDSPLKNREEVNLGGLFVSATMKISRLRKL